MPEGTAKSVSATGEWPPMRSVEGTGTGTARRRHVPVGTLRCSSLPRHRRTKPVPRCRASHRAERPEPSVAEWDPVPAHRLRQYDAGGRGPLRSCVRLQPSAGPPATSPKWCRASTRVGPPAPTVGLSLPGRKPEANSWVARGRQFRLADRKLVAPCSCGSCRRPRPRARRARHRSAPPATSTASPGRTRSPSG